MTIPKMTINRSLIKDEAIYASLQKQSLEAVKLSPNYWGLTPEQRDFVANLIDGCLELVQEQVEDYNDYMNYADE